MRDFLFQRHTHPQRSVITSTIDFCLDANRAGPRSVALFKTPKSPCQPPTTSATGGGRVGRCRRAMACRRSTVQSYPPGSIQGPAEAKWGYTTVNVADWNGDGLPDVLFNSILGSVSWLENIGTRQAPKFRQPQSIEVQWNDPQPALAWGWRKPQGKSLLTQWRTTHSFIGKTCKFNSL